MTELRLIRRFDAPPADVFRAWTEPEELGRWWGPGAFTCERAEVELRPGGRYRLHMQLPDGSAAMILAGEYEVVEPPTRLVYTWRWEAGWDDPTVSRVAIDFRPDGDGTEVTLVHMRLEPGAHLESHRMGWESGLDKLAAQLGRGGGATAS